MLAAYLLGFLSAFTAFIGFSYVFHDPRPALWLGVLVGVFMALLGVACEFLRRISERGSS